MKKTVLVTLAGALTMLSCAIDALAQSEDDGDIIGETVDWDEATAFFGEIAALLEEGATWEEILGELEDERSNYISPYRVDFCGDTSCTTQNMVYQSYSFSFGWSGDNRSRHWITWGSAPLDGVERVRAWASSGADDYCDVYYTGGYWDIDSEVWVAADDYYCDVASGNYWYSIDEEDGIEDYSYDFTPVTIWQYKIDATYYHTILWYYYL